MQCCAAPLPPQLNKPDSQSPTGRYIGLMSGTSLDGVDGVIARFDSDTEISIEAHAHLPFDPDLKHALLDLNSSGPDELHRTHTAANQLAQCYARLVHRLCTDAGLAPHQIRAIGCHGQTVRHRPDCGYTVQIGNAALLAELTGISVISDFRSRDIAAGGQGAPLVPAFHQAMFAHPEKHRVVVNIGGISNLSDLPTSAAVSGFDCGPGNLLMDGWILRHQGHAYDADGTWATGGSVIASLLDDLQRHPFFRQSPPKSTGRDTFHLAWLEDHLKPDFRPQDVQATLLELSAQCIAQDIAQYCKGATEVFLCGGGARNGALVKRLRELLPASRITLTDALGLQVDQVESAAFAWLAQRCLSGLPGNLPAVTGARGLRVLGAIYQA